eukprot:1369370-Rhodomonas_salina.1
MKAERVFPRLETELTPFWRGQGKGKRRSRSGSSRSSMTSRASTPPMRSDPPPLFQLLGSRIHAGCIMLFRLSAALQMLQLQLFNAPLPPVHFLLLLLLLLLFGLASGKWWSRKRVGEYLPPLYKDHPAIVEFQRSVVRSPSPSSLAFLLSPFL